MHSDHNQEYLILLDKNHEEIGKQDKYKVHQIPAKLHKAVSVWLFNDKNQVLFQQRSKNKIVLADHWANTICGNVNYGESYKDCATRRLKQELGITYPQKKLNPIFKFHYQTYCNEKYNEHELDQVFTGSYNGKVIPNPQEVSHIMWINHDILKQKCKKAISKLPQHQQNLLFNPAKTLKTDLTNTKPLINLSIQHNSQNLTLASWTLMILFHPKFKIVK